MLNQNLIDLFWSKVDKRTEDECWEWTSCKNSKGYGRFGPARTRGLSGAKLTTPDIISIRADNRSLAIVGRSYGISKTHVRDIKLKKSWSHVL